MLSWGGKTVFGKIAILSRNEYRQFVMSQDLKKLDPNDRLRFFIGDVRERDRLVRAMEGMKVVIHAAALKRIEVGFYNPIEMVKTNVLGTMNVIDAAIDAGVEKVAFLSSDKAYQPISPYGHSKALAEALVLASNNTAGGKTKFSVTRYGNVWRSTGSVVPVWESMIADGAKKVPVTDPDCTRFFMRMDEAVDLVLKAIKEMPNAPLIPELPAYRLGDLAEAMGVDMEVNGLPAWEKKHESMGDGNSSDLARRMSVDELREALREN
jgi:UDP-N-acetylglucosamine 4,6-dehydratase